MCFYSFLRYGKGSVSATGLRSAIILGAALVLISGISSVRADTFNVGSTRALISAINSANNAGGSHTIILVPGRVFDLKTANNTTDGGNGLPVIGATKAVALTIIGNGATLKRIAVFDRYGTVKNPFRLFDVASGASLTLDHLTLQGGGAGGGGAIFNHGTLNVINGTTLTGNYGGAVFNAGGSAYATYNDGGAIYNDGGTVTVSDSTLSNNQTSGFGGAIYNADGTVTLSNNTLSTNRAFSGGGIYNDNGTVTVSDCTLSGNGARFGGGIYNSGGTVTVSSSALSGNSAYHSDYPWTGGDGGGIYNDGGTVTVSHSTLSGNTADVNFGRGGGIYNNGEVTVENFSSVTGNTASDLGADVYNLGVLYLDSSSEIGILDGNPPF